MMKIYLLDIKQNQVDFWKRCFSDVGNVECVCDEFSHFMDSHPEIECVVSPANSYGLMDGGYDAAITVYFGETLIPHVQAYIRANFFCEQPVGTSFIIDIPKSKKKLIHTPTMRIPSVIKDSAVVYQCMRTTLICALQNDVKSIVIPAFGGSCGRVPEEEIAFFMRSAYDQLCNPPESMDWEYAARDLGARFIDTNFQQVKATQMTQKEFDDFMDEIDENSDDDSDIFFSLGTLEEDLAQTVAELANFVEEKKFGNTCDEDERLALFNLAENYVLRRLRLS